MTQVINAKPLSDLELYELIVAAYPDRFNENSDNDIWDEVMVFAEDQFGDVDNLMELLGRVVMLTSPMKAALSGGLCHCLGAVEIKDGEAFMIAAVSRPVELNQEQTA